MELTDLERNIALKEVTDKYIDTSLELVKYKKLEEELGCPLEVREQALKQGFIYNGFTKLLYICCRYDENGCYLTNGAVKFYLKDYKKRFWLREDKSE